MTTRRLTDFTGKKERANRFALDCTRIEMPRRRQIRGFAAASATKMVNNGDTYQPATSRRRRRYSEKARDFVDTSARIFVYLLLCRLY